MKKRPDILFLMSDEHRADVAGFYGNKTVKTPNLDSLAEDAVVFTNAYTPSPICIPARQSLLAGQYPRKCKCEVYGDDLPPYYETFPRLFSRYAYETVVCGKTHSMGTDQMQGFTIRIGSDMRMDKRYIEGKVQEEFDAVNKMAGKLKWTDAKEIKRAGAIGEGYVRPDNYTVDGAVNYIQEHFASIHYDRPSAKPLLLKVSLVSPHYPYFTTGEKLNYYMNRVEPYFNQQVFGHPFLSTRSVPISEETGISENTDPNVVTKREVRRAVAAYYGMTEQMDESFGRVLAALRAVGQDLDDWIIVYTSDHGEMLGEHGIWEKQKFFEASVKVPLFIRWGKNIKGGRKIDKNVNLVDLFPTLCDMAGIPISEDANLDGRSLYAMLKGGGDWHDETASQFGAKNLMIKKGSLKYQYYGEDMPEVLFDLNKNPEETMNFIDDAAYKDDIVYFRSRRKYYMFGSN